MTGESSPLLGCVPNSANGEKAKNKQHWSLESTESLKAFAAENPEIYTAAHLLRDAVILSKSNSSFAHTDYLISSQPLPDDHGAVGNRLYRKILTNSFFKFLVKISIFGLVLLSFIEPPLWCRDFDDGDDDPLNGCDAALSMKGTPAFYSDDTEDAVQDFYPNTGVTYLSVFQSLKFEWCFVTILLIHTIICFAKDGFSIERYFCLNLNSLDHIDDITKQRMRTVAIYRYVRIFAMVFLLKGMITFSAMNTDRPYSIMIRLILFISYSEGIQNELLVVVRLLPKLGGAFLVLSMVIAFYGLIGISSFYGTLEGTYHFDNYIDGVWTLFTSMTSVIYPDVMMAGYNDNRFVALYFVSYMLLTFFFFQGVILGVIVDRYNSSRDLRADELEKAKAGYIKKAFDLLTTTELNVVTHKQLMAIFLILNDDFDEIPTIPQYEATLLFAILDTDGSEMLEEEEFANFGAAMLLEFIAYDKFEPALERYFPSVKESALYKKIRDIVLSPVFENGVDFIVLLNALVVIIQMYPILVGQQASENPQLNDGLIDSPWEIMETLFTSLFVIEMLLKIATLGWSRYILTLRNKFDGIITVLAVIATFYVYSPNSYNDSHLIRFIVMARSLRVFRLFLAIKPFQEMSNAFFGIMPATGRVFLALFCIVYLFSWIGMMSFGGRLNRDPGSQYSSLLDGTDFAGSFYWANNFNDLLSGVNVCYNLLVINNWNVFESGIDAICETKYYRFYFLTFYIFGVMIVNNLVIALIIDYFLEEVEKDGDAEDADALDDQANLVFDSDDMPTPKAFGRYVATLKPDYHRTPLTKKTVLKKLFASRVARDA